MRSLGLHLRYEKSLLEMANLAVSMGLDFFQCFLTLKTEGKTFIFDNNDMKEFLNLRRTHFKNLFMHSSYWVNLSSVKVAEHKLFARELYLVKKLEFTHVIIHPGSSKGAKKVVNGIDALARVINNLVKIEQDITLVLENVAQSKPSVGGDIEHFKILLEKLDNHERVKFCIDTAHAYAYGYDIKSESGQDEFLRNFDTKVGLDKICLIHLNDNAEKQGSHFDVHARLGDGKIGLEALGRFAKHEKLKGIPVLTEPPVMSENDLRAEFDKLRLLAK